MNKVTEKYLVVRQDLFWLIVCDFPVKDCGLLLWTSDCHIGRQLLEEYDEEMLSLLSRKKGVKTKRPRLTNPFKVIQPVFTFKCSLQD